MSPEGPDVLNCPSMYEVPTQLKAQLEINEKAQPFYTIPNRKKKGAPYGSIPVIYVLDQPEKRLKCSQAERLFGIPLGLKSIANKHQSRYYFKEFVDVRQKDLTELLSTSRQPMEPKTFLGLLESFTVNRRVTLVVKMVKDYLRIKVVTEAEFHEIAQQSCKSDCIGDSYIFGFESSDLNVCPGVLVSVLTKNPLMTQTQLNYSFAQAMVDVYGDRFGSRKRCNSFGLNLYRSPKLTNRSHPSPFMDNSEIKLHQYFSQSWKYPLLQPVLEKRLHALTAAAVQLTDKVHPAIARSVGRACTKQIATCGKPFQSIGFCNEEHRDTCDVLKRAEVQEELDNAPDDDIYFQRLLTFNGFCMPTSCGYQFLSNSTVPFKDHLRPHQFFEMPSIGLAFEIEHGMAHHFLAASFSHHTSVCIGETPDGLLTASNYNNSLLVFAWGRGGGSKDYRVQRAIIERVQRWMRQWRRQRLEARQRLQG